MQSSQAQSFYDRLPDDPPDTEMTVGAILRRTREHYGQSPEEVEAAIRVRAEQIEAIEQDSTAGIPGHVYAIGFVRSYSEYLGLDGDKMVEMFKKQQGVQKKGPDLDFLIPSVEGKLPPKWLVWFCVFAVLAGPYTIWAISGGEEYKGLEIQAVPESLKEPDSFAVIEFDDTQDKIERVTNNNEVLLNVLESSWVEIKDANNRTLISKVLEAGEQYYVPNDPSLKITLGDAGAVQYQDDRGEFVAFGDKGISLRNRPLNLRTNIVPKPSAVRTAPPEETFGAPVIDPQSYVEPNGDASAEITLGEDMGNSVENSARSGESSLPIPQRKVLDARDIEAEREESDSLEIIIAPRIEEGPSYGLNN